jgi:hypothetical protein
MHPSLRLIPSQYPIVTIWEMNQPGRTPHAISKWIGETALVARPLMHVGVETATPAYAAFVASFAQGETLEEAVSAAFSHDEEFDPGAHLARIFASGLVVSTY